MKRVLISLEVPDLAPWNRFSAVACVVCSFAEILHNNKYEVFINQYPFEKVLTELNSGISSGTANGSPSKFVRLFPKRIREIVKDFLLYRKLKAHFNEVKTVPKPDIIISWVSYGSSNGSKLAKFWNIPLISIYDNPLVEEYAFQLGYEPFFRNYIEKQEKIMINSSERVIVYSPAMAHSLTKKFNKVISYSYKQFIDRYKINFINTERPTGNINFLYVGSFFEWHRVDLLISAFADVCENRSDCRLYLVGGGPQQERIERLVKELHLTKLVFFEGFQDKEGLKRIMEKCHIGIIPSALWFHAPVKLFQYAAAGLCILAIKTPTIDFIQQQDNSAIQLFNSKDELIVQMKTLASHPETIALRGATSRRWVEKIYGDKEYLNYFESLFKSIGI